MNQNITNNANNNTSSQNVKSPQNTSVNTNPVQNTAQPKTSNVVEEVVVNPTDASTGINPHNEVAPVETEVINTSRKKSSNIFMFIIIILIIVFIYKIDDVIAYFDNNFSPTISDRVENTTSSNLVDGFIVMNENNSFIKVEKIKFYNFKKSNGEIVYNYVSDKKYKSTDSLGIYIEIYNIEKELLYKELVNISNVETDAIRTNNIKVTNDVYQDAYYILIKTYSEDEKNKKTTLTCKYDESNDMIVLNYKITYNFTNNVLTSYTVSKEFLASDINSAQTKVKDELFNENNEAIKYGITTEYSENKLSYTVDLNNVKEGFKPLYDSNTVRKTIINKESLKKWNCE